MSSRTAGRIIGALLLLAFVLYGTGSFLIAAGTGYPSGAAPASAEHQRIAGMALIIGNSLLVVAIGLLAFPVLRPHSPTTAYAYLGTRIFEGSLLALGGALALSRVPTAQDVTYPVAMLGLALGSLLFCRVLLRARLVPRPLALWGLVGYSLLAVGMALELFGSRAGLALSVPGGLFEVALGVLLVVRGFPERPPDRPSPRRSPVTAIV
ncbi:DUF4386 domain-containing protein [Nocardioides sp.]|uniref:DUF4386 domain-containing protein n=1 Tax=Nocardioides sp. TaxID=35761 RepID=UPI00273449F6|nr:DUF4386 domain-containing protein [Nocardioides sp.]MDP3892521.1 DUF4386 domain-containing protein [Nocardioides sp.]